MLKICLSAVLLFFFSPLGNVVNAAPSFEQKLIDSTHSGDVKLIGDVDGDGDLDLVIAGYYMYWYKNPNWEKTQIAFTNNEFTTDGKLGDIDGDGDLDIIVPDGLSGNNLVWYRNNGSASSWTRLEIGSTGGDWGKDVHISDYDGNGKKDVAVRSGNGAAYVYYQSLQGTWNRVQVYNFGGGEGMTSGDVDGDGDEDLIGPGYWIENPKNSSSTAWTKYSVGSLGYSDFKASVYDLNKDNINDIIYTCSECSHADEIQWYSSASPKGAWTKHAVGNLAYSHTLQVADFDKDGDNDILTGQMVQSSNKELVIYENGGNSQSWTKVVIANPTNGIHNGVIGDIDADGDVDIAGSNWVGYHSVYWWKNNSTSNPIPTVSPTPQPTTTSTILEGYYPFSDSNPTSAADLSGKSHNGIVSGATWTSSGKYGGGMQFDGNDRIDLGNWNLTDNKITLAAWVRLEDNSDDRRIISKASGASEQEHDWMIGTVNGNYLRFRLKVNGSTTTLTTEESGVTILQNEWTHVAATYDGNTMKIYKNGLVAAQRNVSGQITTSSNNIYIGANPNSSYGYWQGIIDEVYIYSTALNQTDLVDMMNSQMVMEKSGDANGDNKVNGLDYIVWLNNYGKQISGVINGDFNKDALVNGLDYIVWLNNYGK